MDKLLRETIERVKERIRLIKVHSFSEALHVWQEYPGVKFLCVHGNDKKTATSLQEVEKFYTEHEF